MQVPREIHFVHTWPWSSRQAVGIAKLLFPKPQQRCTWYSCTCKAWNKQAGWSSFCWPEHWVLFCSLNLLPLMILTKMYGNRHDKRLKRGSEITKVLPLKYDGLCLRNYNSFPNNAGDRKSKVATIMHNLFPQERGLAREGHRVLNAVTPEGFTANAMPFNFPRWGLGDQVS